MASDTSAPSRQDARLKTPKGTRDWVGGDLVLCDQIFDTITTILDRYQVAKVYRRDQPAIARGRLREFYQCDFDIAGVYDPMIPDAEVLCIIAEVSEALRIDVSVKLNHRKILDGLFELDKPPWDEVKREMLDKGISDEVADRVGGFVQRSGGMREMLDRIESEAELSANKTVAEGVADMQLLASYLKAMEVLDKVSFGLSLARGLDYYTGLIYEVVPLPDRTNPQRSQVGSVGAGGRYDGLLFERMRVARELWRAGIRAEFTAKVKPRPAQQFNASQGVPVAVILGEEELAAGQVRVKQLQGGDRDAAVKDKGLLVAREKLIEEVRKLLESSKLERNKLSSALGVE
ncbi:class II aaRS and biotin synthetase [Parathielavia hyrcaniae]|uniref:histidine--tRNA ligase n=1 Tax=Parathielavia hyrcaniae TaxID=113614 RepID=A0AAN6PWW8_9PEZI|nr:class II aaRS and biotin synthetase [Parathielavia hyrcaniae]